MNRRSEAGRPAGNPPRDDTFQSRPRRRGQRWTKRRGRRPGEMGWNAQRAENREARRERRVSERQLVDAWSESEDATESPEHGDTAE
jgi:hypothetical protein